MATLRKRNGKWHVQIRRAHQPSVNKSFVHKADAQRWVRKTEAEIDLKGLLPDTTILKQHTLGDLITRYLEQVTPTKRGHGPESLRLKKIKRHSLASCRLINLKTVTVNKYVEERIAEVCPATVALEVGLLHHIIETAKLQWGIPFQDNPIKNVRRPGKPNVRDRRLEPNEENLLIEACEDISVTYLKPILTIAVETAMRRGEILNIKYDDINESLRTLRIPKTKNGHPRVIPLSKKALVTLLGVPRGYPEGQSDCIFNVSPNALRLSWERLRSRVGIDDLHFHDLRHEAISRLFEKGLSIPEVALISGHRDYRMLFRYTHLRAEDIAAKL